MQPIQITDEAPESLHPHPLNPRVMSDPARARLARSLEHFGLIEPILANRATRHILAGHQRFSWLMALPASSRGATIKVAWVDIPESEEPVLLSLLNNENAQGEWDIHKLTALVSLPDFDADLAGFSAMQLSALLPEIPSHLSEPIPAPKFEEMSSESKKKIRQARSEGKNVDLLNSDTFLVVVFPDVSHKEKFMTGRGLDWRERYVEVSDLFPEEDRMAPRTTLAIGENKSSDRVLHKSGVYLKNRKAPAGRSAAIPKPNAPRKG